MFEQLAAPVDDLDIPLHGDGGPLAARLRLRDRLDARLAVAATGTGRLVDGPALPATDLDRLVCDGTLHRVVRPGGPQSSTMAPPPAPCRPRCGTPW